jgi:dolichol-phosphate mannosyltransferase
MQRRSLSFVIPAYNEAANIGAAVREALAAGARHAPEFEVIVVDDGSADGTAEAAAEAAAGDPRVRVVRHPANRGVGEALKTGFAEARCDLVYWFPGDNQATLTAPTSSPGAASSGPTRCTGP